MGRSVPRLLILPSLLTFALSTSTGHLWGVALMAALILASGGSFEGAPSGALLSVTDGHH